ncbi:HAMP domain-containing sensor histidine kinase [Stigmatella sp. ncwal1]|uniref:histidine kinase n=1 Tax=Stigmatella ashevillensis TaxID=2995309 RepID=A0ABT5DFI7_9BACT|nr:HAMP domain-containing sensor histidine kinase [Stigmatella ashevillena]MDC0712402.1 HAMP domain-containing sensor histidine kinase [Stigmatella ashevillena]
MSLRRVLTSIMVVLGLLVLASIGSVAVLTRYFQRMSDGVGLATEGVRLPQDLQAELLNHYRRSVEPSAESPAVQEALISASENRLLLGLDAVTQIALSTEERDLIDGVRQQVYAYFVAEREARRLPTRENLQYTNRALDMAMYSIAFLTYFNVKEARDTEDQAVRWSRNALVGSTALSTLLLLGLAGMLLWMRGAVLRPVIGVSQAMRRFGAGDKETRAPERGPAELREMALTFNEMAATLAQRQEEQLTFLAGVAHDLRNPLAALKMSTALAGSGRNEASPERIQRMLTLVRRQVARLDRMVGDLLDAARIEAGKLELHLEERDAREMARSVVELFEASGQGRELRLSVPELPVPLRCDGTRMEQVLNNLVSNALKYSPTGTRVDVTVSRQQDEALLTVTDRGIGLSAEAKHHLFSPFMRANNARDCAPGAGLGLSVARRIVEAHGGRIEVESQPGQGATFRVRLSLSRPSPPALPWTAGDVVH